MAAAAEHAPGLLMADLRIARGLDYYTGAVYEIYLVGQESFGSVGGPVGGTTRSPPTARRRTRASGSRSVCPGWCTG